ncbi:hypothetical protein [Salinibacterium xinjiangense]|uniref:hypothetical protein n=1 Tax=Salinibacterium xinjiangense TaxID=386302 RepID=UPI0015C79529|nr:hypothetical protein [Salinibacterium xinjiangense]
MLNMMNASKAEIAAADVAYRNGVVDGQARLRAHLRDTGGPKSMEGSQAWAL